jgi:calcium permeable stress-gated cation channel
LRKQERTPAAPNTLFGWIPFMQKIPDTYVLQHNSLDGYFLLRYIKISIMICFVGCCISWPILFPVNATGGGGEKQLNILTLSNVQAETQVEKLRYIAHAGVAWIFITFIFFTVTRELIYYINLRQAYLMSPLYSQRLSSRTVLFQSVPTEFADEHKIRRMFGDQLRNVWIASDTKELEKMVEQRTKAAMKLEAAETKLIKTANNARLKAIKKGGQAPGASPDEELGGESGSVAARWVRPKDRPTHRLKFLIGKKVDSINWARDEIARLNPLIEKEQMTYRAGEAKPRNGVFVEFHNQVDAQAAYQMVTHHKMLHMSPRVVGMVPEEIVWNNLGMTWKTVSMRNVLSIAAATALIIFWSFPVAVVGSISQISYLTEVLPWLDFINDIPQVILGVVTNLLPSVMLAILVALVPIFFRMMGKLAGKPTLSTVELRCHESFFWFQVIQVFLVTTMTSAASTAVPTIIQNPTSIPSLLAESLPTASNFYVSYIILQGLTFAAAALVQVTGLILFYVLGKLLDTTPRKMYNRWSNLSNLGWGTVFPFQEILTVISVSYSGIAPLMMGFATIGLCLYYLAYRYNLLFVNQSTIDTKGLVYAKALKHTLVGCYLSVICLIGLFAIQYAAAALAMTIVLLVVMILYHITLLNAVNPLLYYLPRSLDAEEVALMADQEGLQAHDGAIGKNAANKNGMEETKVGMSKKTAGKPKVNFFKKWLRPDVYCSYEECRKLVPQDFAEILYSPETERDAYQHPAVTNITPLLW